MGENERKKSGISDKVAMDEGFFDKVTSEQMPEMKDEPLRCPTGLEAR